MRTFATLLCTLFLFTSAHAQKARLSLNLEEGKTYRQISCATTKLKQDVYGQTMEIIISIEGSMSFLVNTVTKTGFDISVQYDSMKISMEMPQGNMELSSENPPEHDYFSQLLAELKKSPFQMTMDRKGKILEMEDLDYKWKSAFEKYDQIPEEQREQIKSQIMNTFGKEARTSSIEMLTAIYPEKAVKPGVQWNTVTNRNMGMPFTLSNTYTYEGREEGLANISLQSSVVSSDNEAWIESKGMMVKYDLSGSSSGQIKVDLESGWTTEATVRQNLEGTTYIKESEQIPGGMEIPMIIKNMIEISNE